MPNRIHSFSNDILVENDAVALAELVWNRDVSPAEIIRATIARAEKVNPTINAIVFENYEQAIKDAAQSSNGFFSGIPIYFKDLTFVKGIPTHFGTEALVGAKPQTKTDPIAKQILSMGFINMGTSTMPEFGFTCSTEFPHTDPTVNPWNPNHSAGGSSGGAGALVAAGVLPIAHAADGGGSIRIPAACCGVVGLKPTRGRILLSSCFDQQLVEICIDGVITRSVRDTAYFYAEAEKYYQNKNLTPIGLVKTPLQQKLNIGYIEASSEVYQMDNATHQAYQSTLHLLEDLGHQLKPVKYPVNLQMVADFKLLWAFNTWAVKKLGRFNLPKPFDPKKLSNLTNALASDFMRGSLKLPMAVRRLRQSYFTYQEFLKKEDIEILATPTVTAITPQIGYFGMNMDGHQLFDRIKAWTCFTPYSNVNGAPSISLPLQHDKENDLPIGMLFSANHGCEKLLLALSYQLEAANPWKKINDVS